MFTPKHINFKISEAKKLAGIHCCAYGCKNDPIKKKCGLCHKHYSIHSRIKDPVLNRYVNFRGNALRREKEFTITLQEFRDFCQKTGYIIEKGKRGRNCSIDRINNNQGYHIENVQIMSAINNTKKYHNEDKILTPDDEDYLPF